MAITPKGCQPHQSDYSNSAWELYSLAELGQWVHLLTKRAEHRTNLAKKDKDLTDASNYLAMMQSKLDEARHVNIEDFAQQIVKRLADALPAVHLVEAMRTVEGAPVRQPEPHDLASLSLMKKSEPYIGFADTWTNFIEPAIVAIVEDIGGTDVIYELETTPADPGARSLVVTFENMSVRFVTGYDSLLRGTRTRIDVGVPKEGKTPIAGKYVDGKFYAADAEKPKFIEKRLDGHNI